jgi:hypothetical protein
VRPNPSLKLSANGKVVRSNGRLSEVLTTTRYDSGQNLEDTLSR